MAISLDRPPTTVLTCFGEEQKPGYLRYLKPKSLNPHLTT